MAVKTTNSATGSATGEIISPEERGLTTYAGSTGSTGGMLMPLTDPEGARAAIAAYEQLKTAIVRPDDIQIIQGRNFLKKSFWRRVAACFGLSLEMVGEERLLLDGKLAYRATYRAIAPNGRTMDGDGMCMQGEKGTMIEHNIRAIAHTRAKNRAISDIVGGGEVSAEEMPDDEGPFDSDPRRPAARPAPRSQASAHGSAQGRTVDAQPAPEQATAPAADRISHALRQADILQLLNRLGRRSMADQRRELEAVFEAIERDGQTVNLKNVKAEIQARIDDFNAVDASAATGNDEATEPTEPYDLKSLGAGHGVH